MGPQRLQQVIRELAGERRNGLYPDLAPKVEQYFKACNSTGSPLPIHEVMLLDDISRRIDSERNIDWAWDMTQNVLTNCLVNLPEELKAVHRAVSDNVDACTVVYVDREKNEVSSGTLVEIQDRIFVATTAHSIRAATDGSLRLDRVVLLIPSRYTGADDTPVPVLGGTWHPEHATIDVAFLEIARSSLEILGKRPISIDRLGIVGAGQASFSTMVAGFAVDIARVTVRPAVPKTRFAHLGMLTWKENCVPQHLWNWLKLPDQQKADSTIDVFLPWPTGEDEVQGTGVAAKNRLGDPSGMSGGGFWQLVRNSDSEIWTAENYRLIAIQSGWHEPGQYLRGTQIIHWLRLLWHRYPALRTALQAPFPGEDLARMF